MAFYESPRFPDAIAYGALGGPAYATDVIAFDSGHEVRAIKWSVARARYDVAHAVKTPAEYATLLAFFRAMRGRAHGFRFKDWLDFAATSAEGRLGAGAAGTGLAAYQLIKRYATASPYEDRDIKKPVSGSVTVYRNASPVAVGAGAGQIAIDTSTGLVTFVADSSANVTAITVGSTTQVTFASALSGLAVGGKLYLSGITGTVAATLNGLAHTISNIASNVYTLSVNTTGLAYTSGGSGAKYPQPTDALTWAGEFDVPVRFDIDTMQVSYDTYQSLSWQSVPLVELRV